MSKTTFAENQQVIDDREDQLRDARLQCEDNFAKHTKNQRGATYTLVLNHQALKELHDLLWGDNINEETNIELHKVRDRIEDLTQNG